MSGKANHRGWGWLRQMPTVSKRWQASYIGPDLVRHCAPATFTAKMDAEGWLASERRLIERGEWTSPATRKALASARGITVADYVERWIEQRQVSDGVRYAYSNHLRISIAPKPLGAVPISALTPEAVRGWFASLDPSKPSARAAVYSMLRAAMNTACDDGLFDRNPVSIPNATKTPPSREATILTIEQIAELANGVPAELRAWILIAAWCGPRIGESSELRRGDISDDYTVLTIRRSCRHVGGSCAIKDGTKSGKIRTVTIPRHIRADIKHHLDVFVAAGDDALVFTYGSGRKCGHMSDDAARKAMQPVLDRILKGKGMRIHDLRHTAGTLAAKSGATLAETMGRLGHSTVRAAMIYQGIADGADAAVADRLSDMAERAESAA
jgi:integrase